VQQSGTSSDLAPAVGPGVPVAVQVPPVPVTALVDEAASFPRSALVARTQHELRRLRRQVDLLAGSLRNSA
jgi:hypothetical protein